MQYKYAPKADSNHSEIVGFYEELYCSVLDLHKVGGGCPDLLIGCAGRSELVEVKPEAGQLRANQITFNKTWRGNKVMLVHTRADVVNHVAEIRERVSRGRK